jgi:hypothetical protein
VYKTRRRWARHAASFGDSSDEGFGEELQSKKPRGNTRRRWRITLNGIFKSGMRGAWSGFRLNIGAGNYCSCSKNAVNFLSEDLLASQELWSMALVH